MQHAKRNLGIIALAVFCCFLVGATQPVQAVIPIIIGFALGALAIYVVDWLLNTFATPSAGVDPDSLLSLFFNAKNNEWVSLTVAMMDQASSLDAMGYYLGRKTEYAAMSYLNDTLYPTYPQWQILNASVMPELSAMWAALVGGYAESAQDAVRYAQLSFTGTLAGLNLKADSTSLLTGSNDLQLAMKWSRHVSGTLTATNYTLGYIVVTNVSEGTNWVYLWGPNLATLSKLYLEDQLSANSTVITCPNTAAVYYLSPGIYKATLYLYSDSGGNNFDNVVATPALVVYRNMAHYASYGSIALCSPSRHALYSALNFIDTSSNTYTISTTNATTCYANQTAAAIDTAINYANSLANAYWTTLRAAGIYSIEDIPEGIVIPLPDFGFISNEDLANLTQYEIMAMYLMYLKALGNFFNSSTYETITNLTFTYANVTFANCAVIVEGYLYRNDTLITNGSLYFQIYADMNLSIGNNTLPAAGLVYNLNDTTCFMYGAGDVLNATAIYVRDPETGDYVNCTSVNIQAQTIETYLHTSNSGAPATPTGGGSSSGGSSGLLIIIIAVLAVLLLARGKSGSDSPINVIMPKSRAASQEHRPEAVHYAAFVP